MAATIAKTRDLNRTAPPDLANRLLPPLMDRRLLTDHGTLTDSALGSSPWFGNIVWCRHSWLTCDKHDKVTHSKVTHGMNTSVVGVNDRLIQ
jgi:hypothetical protein